MGGLEVIQGLCEGRVIEMTWVDEYETKVWLAGNA